MYMEYRIYEYIQNTYFSSFMGSCFPYGNLRPVSENSCLWRPYSQITYVAFEILPFGRMVTGKMDDLRTVPLCVLFPDTPLSPIISVKFT